MLRSSVGAGVVAALVVGALSACGNTPSVSTEKATPEPPTSPRSSAAAGPCSTVTITTAIAEVPAACAALWAPYGVTKVPPVNLTDSTPLPSNVVNATQGAVPDADARAWALAANRTGVWLRWSEQNDQFGLTRFIEGSHVVNAQLDALMRSGTSVFDPDCDLFAQEYQLFPMVDVGKAFFAAFGEATTDPYVFVEHYPGPCAITVKTATSPLKTLLATPNATVSLSVGQLRQDPMLGAIWFGDGAAFCTDRGAPEAWCGS